MDRLVYLVPWGEHKADAENLLFLWPPGHYCPLQSICSEDHCLQHGTLGMPTWKDASDPLSSPASPPNPLLETASSTCHVPDTCLPPFPFLSLVHLGARSWMICSQVPVSIFSFLVGACWNNGNAGPLERSTSEHVRYNRSAHRLTASGSSGGICPESLVGWWCCPPTGTGLKCSARGL